VKFFLIILLISLVGCGGEEKTVEDDQNNIVINEIFRKSSKDRPDWIELYNKGSETIDISGWQIRDSMDRTPYLIPDGTEIGSEKFLVITQDETGETGFVFGLGNADKVRVYDAEEIEMDKIEWEEDDIPENESLGRIPDGTENIQLTITPTPGVKNI